jgi:hypothetical protein
LVTAGMPAGSGALGALRRVSAGIARRRAALRGRLGRGNCKPVAGSAGRSVAARRQGEHRTPRGLRHRGGGILVFGVRSGRLCSGRGSAGGAVRRPPLPPNTPPPLWELNADPEWALYVAQEAGGAYGRGASTPLQPRRPRRAPAGGLRPVALHGPTAPGRLCPTGAECWGAPVAGCRSAAGCGIASRRVVPSPHSPGCTSRKGASSHGKRLFETIGGKCS